MAFITAAKMREFEREADALRISMRTRATTGDVPTIVFGAKFARLWEPAEHKAYFGPRGSAKSHHVALYEVIRADNESIRIACARQFQASIRDSSKSLIEQKIHQLGLSNRFKITEQEIWNKHTESHFIFKGLERNKDSLRSLEGVDLCSVEEARNISQDSIDMLLPTIRNKDSELIWKWNPVAPDDPVDKMFRGKYPPANSIIQRVGINDNPYFYQTRMPSEMWRLKRQNEKAYAHVWLGEYDLDPEARVFHNTTVGRISSNDLEGYAPNYGMDLGFAGDPTVVVKVWVLEKHKTVYVQKQSYGYAVPNNELGSLILSVADGKSDLIIADSSEQRTINYLQSEDFNIVPATKGPGSIRAGISWLSGYKIIIDPSCHLTIDEARGYKWQVHKLTGQRLGAPVDSDNHSWDAIRYATEHLQLGQGDIDPDDTAVILIPFSERGFRKGARRMSENRFSG